MKKYKVKCQEGCGTVLGTLELKDNQVLTDQDKGYLCPKCAQKLSVNLVNKQPASPIPAELRQKLEAFKTKLGPKKSIGSAELDELVEILFQK